MKYFACYLKKFINAKNKTYIFLKSIPLYMVYKWRLTFMFCELL